MNLIEKLSLSSEDITRKKPYNYKNNDENLFKNEFTKKLPNIFPILNSKSFIPPCGRLFNKIAFNFYQFNTKITVKELIKSYLKSILFLMKSRKIKRIDYILFVTNSNSYNFFHWFLDVLQKLEFVFESKNEILNSKIKIIIPNGHNNSFVKKSLESFNLDFYFQKKNEIIVSNHSILLPDIAPTGNYRKNKILKLAKRLRNYWTKNEIRIPNYKKIYISRKNSKKRRLINESEIIPILKKKGFLILDFDNLNFEEQLSYTLYSEILVSVHGAGLTHMLWMKKKSKILEIRARNNYDDNCYYSLASDLGHDYYYTIADKTHIKKSFHLSDLVINVDEFSTQLSKMLI